MKPDLKQAPKFTPDELADVYAKRWMIRDMAQSFLRHVKPVVYHDVGHPVFRRTVAFGIPPSLLPDPPK